jgi:hypothetical protein
MEKLLFRRSSAAPGSMTQESVHNNTSVTRRLIQKAHPWRYNDITAASNEE